MSTPTKHVPSGHAAHTQDAAAQGLPGQFSRPIKLTFLGAGSAFAPRLSKDVLLIPGNAGGTIALVDIDAERLALTAELVRRLAQQDGGGRWQVEAHTDRRLALPGTDYVVNCIEVSGLACVELDNDIPLKYGVDQCIGDTIGPGGLFKSLRTIPVWIEVLRDCEELCPQALVLNYTNPMVMMCLAAGRTSQMPFVGLCHSVQGTSQLLSRYAGVPYEEMQWQCAGINHLAWFTKLEHQGQSLYPRLYEKFAREVADGIAENDAGVVRMDAVDPRTLPAGAVRYAGKDLVRKDMCLHFGAFITESSGHLSEYLPYYRKSPQGRRLLRLGYDGGSRFYASNWPRWRLETDAARREMVAGTRPMDWSRSWEYASWIIEGREKNVPFHFHGNVMNRLPDGRLLIDNLPADNCVEVETMVDAAGYHPQPFGRLPRPMAAICASNLAMFDLGAQAAIEKSVELAIQALLLDPLCQAACTPAQIKAMTLELFAAEKDYLPGYR